MNDKCNRNKQGMGFCNKRHARIHASNERGAEKRTMLFEFQILLSAVSRVNNKENLNFKVINNDYLLSTGS